MSYFRMVYPTLSSAITRFTVLFEMGRSGSRSLLSPSNSFARSSELCEFGLTDGFCFDINYVYLLKLFSHLSQHFTKTTKIIESSLSGN